MSTLNFLDVSLRPGGMTTVKATFSVPVDEPALFVEGPLAYRFRSVMVTGITINCIEALTVREIPLSCFDSLDGRLPFERLRLNEVLKVRLANPLGAPAAVFRLWVGARADVKRLVNPDRCPEANNHMWGVEASSFSRCNRCRACGAYWVAEGV